MKAYVIKNHRKLIAFFYILLLLWSFQYFTTPYIKFDALIYNIEENQDNRIVLQSKKDNLLVFIDRGKDKTVITYKEKQYSIVETNIPSIFQPFVSRSKVYEVTYVNESDKRYLVHKGINNANLTYYENGDEYTESYEQKDNLRISPRALLQLIDIDSYDKQGNWLKFMFAVLLGSFGLLCLFNKFTQEFIFLLRYDEDSYLDMESHIYYKVIKFQGLLFVVIAGVYLPFTL